MTTAEYLQTPETVLPQELAYGTLRVAEAPSIPHQRVVGEMVLTFADGIVVERVVFARAQSVRSRVLGDIELTPLAVFGW